MSNLAGLEDILAEDGWHRVVPPQFPFVRPEVVGVSGPQSHHGLVHSDIVKQPNRQIHVDHGQDLTGQSELSLLLRVVHQTSPVHKVGPPPPVSLQQRPDGPVPGRPVLLAAQHLHHLRPHHVILHEPLRLQVAVQRGNHFCRGNVE